MGLRGPKPGKKKSRVRRHLYIQPGHFAAIEGSVDKKDPSMNTVGKVVEKITEQIMDVKPLEEQK